MWAGLLCISICPLSRMQTEFTALCLLSVIAVVNCFSTGAPTSACVNIYPEGHSGESLDLTTNPFNLSLSNFDESYGGEIYYVPGEQYSCK